MTLALTAFFVVLGVAICAAMVRALNRSVTDLHHRVVLHEQLTLQCLHELNAQRPTEQR